MSSNSGVLPDIQYWIFRFRTGDALLNLLMITSVLRIRIEFFSTEIRTRIMIFQMDHNRNVDPHYICIPQYGNGERKKVFHQIIVKKLRFIFLTMISGM